MKLTKLLKICYLKYCGKHSQKGQAILIVLAVLLLLSLVTTAALSFVEVSLKTNGAYTANTNELYAAEAGIQDGIWQMMNDTPLDLGILLSPVSPNSDTYNNFEYYNDNGNPNYNKVWIYQLTDATNANPTLFNGYNVNIKVKNSWVPLVDYNTPNSNYPNPPAGAAESNYTPPTLSQANSIFQNTILQAAMGSGASLVISGQVTTIPVYTAKITYTGSTSLPIYSIGCWLPQGFTYNNGSSNLYLNGHSGDPVYQQFSSETTPDCAGNDAVVWTFPSGTTFSNLMTAMGQTGTTLTLNFSYTTSLSKLPECLPWIVWGSSAGDFTWDADVTVNDMLSIAGNTANGYTEVEAYVPVSATRILGNAVDGDYIAAGGSNRTDNSTPVDGLRETSINSSSSQVSIIPSTASVEAAYLYWGGWVRGDADPVLNSNVTSNGGYFYDSSVNLSSTNGGNQTVNVASTLSDNNIYWSDKVKSSRGGTITITPGSKNVTGNGTDFQSTGSSDGVSSGGLNRDQIGVQNADGSYSWFIVQTVNSNSSLTLQSVAPNMPAVNPPNYWQNIKYVVFDGYYYACKTDVTDFVRDYSQNANLTAAPKVFGDGDSTYSVSGVYSDRNCVQDQDHPTGTPENGVTPTGANETCTAAWAGWSLVIIYSDPSVLGHQIYLFDNFMSIANDGNDHPTQISGFIVPAPDTSGDAIKLTAFVGEGDISNTGDFFAIRVQSNSTQDNILWDGIPSSLDSNDTSPSGNWVSSTAKDAFNSLSLNSAIPQAGGPYYLNASGVDIDTFHVPWSANLVQQNDTTATIVINPSGDGLISVYTIASFRSSVTTGGSVSYLIRRKAIP
jgi:hypothetical protein